MAITRQLVLLVDLSQPIYNQGLFANYRPHFDIAPIFAEVELSGILQEQIGYDFVI